MQFHKKLTINAPPEQVFSYWADFHNFQQFIPIIERIDILDDRRSRWIVRTPLNHEIIFESLITTFEPGKTLAWESAHSDGKARGEVRLIETGETTGVEFDFEYSLYRDWMKSIARVVSHFGFPSLAFDHGLARIKQQIEKGNI